MIPVFEPVVEEEDIEAVLQALRGGEISGSFGTFIPEFEQAFAAYCGCEFGVAVSSSTAALMLAVIAAGIGPGDEVLVSGCTNIATARVVVHNCAVPVLVDSEELTWNLDLDLIRSLITPKTEAILTVNLYGHPVDMDRLIEITREHGLTVIEDCAESHSATCRGRMTGSFGSMGCYGFYANKVITPGGLRRKRVFPTGTHGVERHSTGRPGRALVSCCPNCNARATMKSALKGMGIWSTCVA